ncbi:heart- and neural crest derivatives-expressed protein 2-like [Dreissena polymorpha]|uniref:BHLH domain-containing protein n=1 Tax=Dreissena polymorpha TaxID=45954 RepID=A0A9D4KQH9_DREPO|nr:heart- and neural crest derivatives-expressed protein 2-like [Dreissena polymorpha]XP_052278931.1 heart- and neural crest derivatives-expressed protein 2-like [Dreissena polymorpha]KAH3842145.1 hypothetical protein DPMN_115639 [Dreissena polymorpha]KAH3843981.1 hypothetical protein DPMN_117516 [Dreissena polymorpha]
MSLSVGGYHPGYGHPGPMGVTTAHEFYGSPYQAQAMRYPDYNVSDRNYFHNWVLSGTPEVAMSPDAYGHHGGDMLTHMSYDAFGNPFVGERCVKRKVNASKKERRRTQSLNNAFTNLRDCIPNVPSDTKLSKIKTLRLAISYISYLMDILKKDDPKLTEKGFKAEISRKRERHHIDMDKIRKLDKAKEEDENTSPSPSKKDKRSGWPEHVWASELKTSE